MVTVSYEPRKQLIIHEYTKYDSIDELVGSLVIGAPPGAIAGPLQWAEGVAMKFNIMPLNCEPVIKELLEGRIHWDHVSFAPHDKCIPVTINNVTMMMVNVTNNPTFASVAKFIKETWLKPKP